MTNSKKSILLMLVLMVVCWTGIFSQSSNQSAIEKEIKELGLQVVKALNESDSELLLSQFWKSDDARFMINGYVVRGYDAIAEGLRQGIEGRVMKLSVLNEEVSIIDENSAMHIVEFDQEVSYNYDRPAHHDRGAWVAVYRNMDGEWKVVLVHESYNPVE